MSIVDRSFQFISMAVQAVIFVVIALMVLRLIANAADLNPFAWTSRTIHRLTDVFVLPMRRSLLRLGFDPKYAPLGVILVTIILGLFSLQLASLLAVTVHGVVVGVIEGRPFFIVGNVLYGAVVLYILLITIRIVFSWGQVSYSNRIMRFVVNATEPLLGPMRNIIPPFGPFDISAMIAIFILLFLLVAINGTLLSSGTLR